MRNSNAEDENLPGTLRRNSVKNLIQEVIKQEERIDHRPDQQPV